MPDMTIPIGPQHPALKEPACFTITLDGETIVSMNMRLGYNHRGIEKACEQRSYIQAMYLVERVCGICSHSHASCFVRAAEEMAAIEISPRAARIRAVIAELERVHSHLLWLGVAAHEIGFDTLLMYAWRDRELVMDALASISGNRVNYGINTIGGVRRDISREQASELFKTIATLEERTKYYREVASEETTMIKRLSGVGLLPRADALAVGAVGPTARASGIDADIRRDDPCPPYPGTAFKVVTDNHCDVYGRTLVRIGELLESYSLVRLLADGIPDGPLAVKAPRKIPAGEAFIRCEAPRGENVHYVLSGGGERPERVKIRAPTLANLQAVAKMMENGRLADAPIIVAAIDPCFSCADRMISLRRGGRRAGETLSWQALRDRSIEWHRRRGIDFAPLNARFERKMQHVTRGPA